MTPVGFGVLLLAALAVALLLAGAGCGIAVAGSAPGAGEGQRIFKNECASCHGEGGARIPAAPLASAEFLDSRGDATLMSVIAEGKGVMPAFGKERGGPLTEDQVRLVLAHLSVAAGRTSSSLTAEEGRKVFQESCSRCHGEKGDRIPAAPLSTKGFLDTRTDADLVRSIADGKGLMPAWSKDRGGSLNDNQIRSAVAFLRYSVDASVAQRSRQGRELYLGSCLACHGERGDRVPGISLAGADYLSKMGDGNLILVVSDGKGVMPGFGTSKGGAFGVSETAALLTYMKSWAGLRATAALTGPEQVGSGRDLFMRNCTPCHGEGGDQVAGVQLRSPNFLGARTERVVRQTIAQGNVKGMPAWSQSNGGPFSEEQVDAVVRYLASSAGPGAPVSASAAPAAASSGAPAAPASASLVSKGKEIYTKSCTLCHGDTRDKVPTCKLADKDWVAQKGEATMIQSVTNGKGPMPAWGQAKGGPLSEDDVKAVVAYLRDAVGLKDSAPAGTAAAATAPAAASGGGGGAALATKGQQVYTQNCLMCHGEKRDLVPNCKLADGDWLKQKGDDGLVTAITKGKAGTIMPAWEGKIPADDIKAIVAYLKDAAGVGGGAAAGSGAAPAAAAGSGANGASGAGAALATKGQQVYTQNCLMCHGEKRDLVPNCKLADGDWLKQKGDDGLVTAITKGKAGTIMPAWEGKIPAEDIKAIVAYLKDAAGVGGAQASPAATSGGANGAGAPTSPSTGTGGGAVAGSSAAAESLTAGEAKPSSAQGKQLFTQNCVMCHGANGMQQPNCKLGSREWLMNTGEDGLKSRIANGKPAGGMPAWGKAKGGPLSDNQITSIMTYLFEGITP